MAPRNISTVVCCYRSRTPCKTIPTCTVNTNSNSPSFLSSKGLDVVAALKATGPKFIPLLGCGRLAEQHSSSEENDCQPTRVLSVPHGFLLPSSPSSSSSSSWERDFHVIGFAVLLSGECFFLVFNAEAFAAHCRVIAASAKRAMIAPLHPPTHPPTHPREFVFLLGIASYW